jgi:hypothetical protein
MVSTFSNMEGLVSYTFTCDKTVKEELVEWAMEESNEDKAIRIFKVARRMNNGKAM